MFWNRSNPSKAEPSAKEVKISVPPENDFDRALDTLGAVLRAFGDFAFDTDRSTSADVKDRAAQLIRKVILGDVREAGQSEPTVTGPPKRDFGSVHRFISEQRKHERDYVATSLGNLRHAVREFAQCLSEAICEDRASDSRVESQLVKLETAAKSSDTDAIRREALVVSELVKQVIAKRRDREAEQLLQLGKQVKALRQELDEARAQAVVDPLTQLYNRAAFDDEIEKVARLGLLLGSEPCLIMVDVDHFKAVNDQYGHPSGDIVLRAVADNLVRHFLRKEDFVTRYGGEEFAIVVRDSTLDKVASRIERAREVLAQMSIKTPSGNVKVTQSAGLSAFIPGESAQRWIERADKSLYAAKHAGRNCVVHSKCEP